MKNKKNMSMSTFACIILWCCVQGVALYYLVGLDDGYKRKSIACVEFLLEDDITQFWCFWIVFNASLDILLENFWCRTTNLLAFESLYIPLKIGQTICKGNACDPRWNNTLVSLQDWHRKTHCTSSFYDTHSNPSLIIY